MWEALKDGSKAIRAQGLLIVAAVLSGVVLGPAVRAVVLLGRAAREAWWPAAGVGAVTGVLIALLWMFARSTIIEARISKLTLRLGGADVEVTLDPNSRQQLWRFFIEMTSRVATRGLSPGSGLLEEALNSLYSLFDRARTDLSAQPPRETAPAGTVPPHIYVLDILNEDLRPCLARWHIRLEAWKQTGLPESEWPLRDTCRTDLERTRERVVERAWQLGTALEIPNLARLLPVRPPATPPNPDAGGIGSS